MKNEMNEINKSRGANTEVSGLRANTQNIEVCGVYKRTRNNGLIREESLAGEFSKLPNIINYTFLGVFE